MLQALLYGLAASGALVIGSFVGTVWHAPRRVTGVLLAFASGSLICAVAVELFPEAVELGGLWISGGGLLAGAATFVAVDSALDRYVAPRQGEQADQRHLVREAARDLPYAGGVEGGSPMATSLALLAAVTLDGLPENFALGVSLGGDGPNVALLVAIFASNLPEALVGSIAMRSAGRTRRFALGVWAGAAVLLTVAVVLGQALDFVDRGVLGFLVAFAGGAVLASLADTLMPEAFEHGKPLNAFATAAGFYLSFGLAT